MKKSDLYISFTLFFAGVFSRFPLLEKFQSHWDGPQYSIALTRFSFEQQTPAPPGYPLYIALGKFFYIFINDPHVAILSVSVLASGVGAVVLYLIGKKMYKREVGIASSLIFLTASTFYYFGLTPYAYLTIPTTTTLLAYVTYLIFIKKKKLGVLFGIVYAISFGIRPQETFQIIGLLLLSFFTLTKQERIKSIIAFFPLTLLWLIPVLRTEGVVNFFQICIKTLGSAIAAGGLWQRIELMVKGFLLSFGLSSLALFYYVVKFYRKKFEIVLENTKPIIFYSAWILPGVFYNLFMRSEHAGYQMTYLSGFLMLISLAIWKLTEKRRVAFNLVITLISIFNLYWFFYDRDPNFVKPYRPTSFHYSDVRKNDLKTGSKIDFVISKFSPDDTLIITNSVLWRPFMYHLKNFQVTSLDGIIESNPKVIYKERDGKNWDMNTFDNKDLFLVIPNNIKNVVFVDDNNFQWIKDYPYEVFNLPGNSNVSLMSVSPGDKIEYKYHLFTIIEFNNEL